jgi:hypothetical protein
MSDTTPAAPAPGTTPAPAASTSTPAIPTDPAALAARDAELTALAETDLPRYRYADGGKLANEHVAIRRAQQAAAQEAEESEGDEPTDVDAEAIDLDAPNEVAEEETDEETEQGEVGEIEASSSDEAVGVDSYTPPAIDGVEWADDALKPIIGVAARHGVSEAALSEALTTYGEVIQQQQARLVEMDRAASKETTAALTERLGSKEAAETYVATAREAAALMPKSLREALKQARLPNGQLVAHMPELTEFLHNIASRPAQATKPFSIRQPQGNREMLQEEARQLNELMRTDIDQYRREWRGSGQTGSARLLAIRRELAAEGPTRPSQGDLDSEERALLRLRRTDPQNFAHGDWNGSGRPGAERLVAIHEGRG